MNIPRGGERRKLPRIRVAWKSAVVADSIPGAHPLKGVSVNLTPAGVAVKTDQPCPGSDNVLVYLMPGDETGKDDRVFRFRASIIHTTTLASGVVTGFRFKENESLVRLKEILGGADVAPPSTGIDLSRLSQSAPPLSAALPKNGKGAGQPTAPASSAPMGLLEKIQAEAAQKLADNAATEDLKRRLHENWCLEVDASLRNAFAYFGELVKSLNILKPKYSGVFAIPCVSHLEDMTWIDDARVDYKIRKAASDIDRIESLVLAYHWKGNPEKRKVLVRNEDKKFCEKAMETCGMPYHSENSQDSNGQPATLLSFPCLIPCSIAVLADDEANLLRLRLRNVGKGGIAEYELPLDRLDKSILDEVTRLILGEKSNLDRLCQKRENSD